VPGKQNEWAFIGVGREDGIMKGEFSPIFYRPAVWVLEKFETVWLSKTPDVPSKGWDASSTRILTIGLFRHIKTERKLLAMNTHMDDQGKLARLEGAKLIVKQITRFSEMVADGDNSNQIGPLPVFLAGDFNSEPNEEAYGVLNAADSPVHDLRDTVCYTVPAPYIYGHENTFTGFGKSQKEDPEKRIGAYFQVEYILLHLTSFYLILLDKMASRSWRILCCKTEALT
jgi:endonuclease/exonuclease/phosphatase family metal-dependent hydrolase